MKKIFCGVFLTALFSSCGNAEKSEMVYFDLPAYFASQAKTLDSLNLRAIKIVSENGKSESANTDSVNWTNELKLFSENDLNKAVYQKKFVVDTVLSDETFSIVYSAVDTNMNIRFVMIDFASPVKVVGVQLKLITRNKIYSSTQTLRYKPLEEFSVEREETVFPDTKKNFSVYTRMFKQK